MSGHKVVSIGTPSTPGDAASKSYVDSSTVSKTGDTMTGNLIMQVGNNPSIYLGCNDLRGGPGRVPKRFNLLLGSTTDMIQNQVGQGSLLYYNQLMEWYCELLIMTRLHLARLIMHSIKILT
jgi:hypothetical protein